MTSDTTAKLRVLVVDDHPLFRDGVARTLDEAKDFVTVGKGASADEALRLTAELDPDLVLLDLSMPGGGLNALPGLLAWRSGLRVVVLTASEEDDDVLTALRAGAHGYVLKGVDAERLCEIVRGVAAGESYVSPSLAARILAELRNPPAAPPSQPAHVDLLSTLTRREDQILAHVAAGRSNKEIARELDLQEKTVKHHMTSILQKLHVRNRTEAAILRTGSRKSSI